MSQILEFAERLKRDHANVPKLELPPPKPWTADHFLSRIWPAPLNDSRLRQPCLPTANNP